MHWHCDFLWTCLLSWLIVLPWLIFISRDHKIDKKKVISIVHFTRVFNILWKPFWWWFTNLCYLGPLGQSLVVNCLNQKGVIEVVNLVDFKRYHEKVDLSNNSKMNIIWWDVCLFQSAIHLHDIGDRPARVFWDIVEQLRVRLKDSLHLLPLENLFVVDISTVLVKYWLEPHNKRLFNRAVI